MRLVGIEQLQVLCSDTCYGLTKNAGRSYRESDKIVRDYSTVSQGEGCDDIYKKIDPSHVIYSCC